METLDPSAIRFVLDTTQDAVIVCRHNRIEFANRAAEQLLGSEADALVNREPAAVLTAKEGSDELARALDGAASVDARITLVGVHGSPVPVQLRSTAERGRCVLVMADAGERLDTQAVLADTQRRLRDLQSMGQVGLWHWTPSTDEMQWSAQLYDIHDLDPLDVEATLAGHLSPVREDDRDELRATLLEAATHGLPVETEYVIVRRDGEERRVLSRADPVLDDAGNVVGLTGITQDVTATRQALEDAERANARLERVATALAHDLREPLIAIAGFADILAEGDMPDEGLRMIERIQANAAQSLDLMGAILQDADTRASLQSGTVDLAEIVAWVVETLQERIERSGSRLEAENLPEVDGHGALLKQAFLNLVGNAIKYRRTGEGAHVRVTATPDGDEFVVRVDDDGPGIPQDGRELVFEDGYRLQRDIDRRIDGTGTGLATVRDVASRHDTTVEVGDSDLGGASFAFRLRRVPLAGPADTAGSGDHD